MSRKKSVDLNESRKLFGKPLRLIDKLQCKVSIIKEERAASQSAAAASPGKPHRRDSSPARPYNPAPGNKVGEAEAEAEGGGGRGASSCNYRGKRPGINDSRREICTERTCAVVTELYLLTSPPPEVRFTRPRGMTPPAIEATRRDVPTGESICFYVILRSNQLLTYFSRRKMSRLSLPSGGVD